MLPGRPDHELIVPMNTMVLINPTPCPFLEALTDWQDTPGVVEFGPATTLGEMRAAEPGPKRRYDDKLYNPTPKEVHQRCEEIIKQHKKSEKERKQAGKKQKVSGN